jgi:hypothetical protein
LAKDSRHEKPKEIEAWAEAYVWNVICSDVEAFRQAIASDKLGRGSGVIAQTSDPGATFGEVTSETDMPNGKTPAFC